MFRFSIFSLLLMAVLVHACAPVEQAPIPSSAASLEQKGTERVDYSCAYFYFLWGRYAELDGQLETALEAYEKALICDPQAEYIVRKMPVLLLRLERIEEAVNWLNLYLAEHPNDAGARMLLAKIYVRQKRPEDAAQQYRSIQAGNPEDVVSRLLLAELYFHQQKWEESEAVLRELLARDSASYPATLLLARLYLRQQRLAEARSAYQNALALNWSEELLLELGELDLQTKNYNQAIAVYQQGLEREPASEQLQIALVHALLQAGRDEDALKKLQELRELSSDPSQLDLTMARLYARQKKFTKALAILEKLLETEENGEARFLLALIEYQEKRYDKALNQAARITPEDEEYRNGIFLQVEILRQQEKADKAIRVLEQAVAREAGRTGEMFGLLAALHEQQGNVAASRKILQDGVALFPEDGELLYEYGIFLDSSGESGQALEIMQRVIGLDPSHAAALNYIGYTWADKAVQLDKALEYIERAVQLKPDNGYIRDSLGWVYFRLGRLDEARVALEEALRLTGDDPAIHEHLGDLAVAQGRMRDAATSYGQALQLLKEEKDRVRLKGKLKAMKDKAP